MDRARRVASLWNWLPVFRVVAELESVQSAARSLHVSASAVSRTIRLLEDDVGQELFLRRGRTLRLNDRGQSLLMSVRDAMRLVEEGVRATGEERVTTVRIACAGDHALTFLWRALAVVERQHPGLEARISTPTVELVAPLLLQGELDVSFGYRATRAPPLTVEVVSTVTHGIYCGPHHPLFRERALDLDRILTHAFVAPSRDESHGATDFWPIELVRKVSVFVPSLAPALEMCRHGAALAVLPDGIPGAAGLRRLPVDVVPPVRLYATYRRPLSKHEDVAALLVRAMKGQMSKKG